AEIRPPGKTPFSSYYGLGLDNTLAGHSWPFQPQSTYSAESMVTGLWGCAEQERLLAQQLKKILQKDVEDHETKIENAKDLCDTFLNKSKDFSECYKAFIGGEESEVKKEISKAQDRVIMETVSRMSVMLCASGWLPMQEHDVSVVETYHQSLVPNHSEETILSSWEGKTEYEWLFLYYPCLPSILYPVSLQSD
ncbi:hypothetical protein A6R68_19351, partial [Neotoma lepida]